MMATTLNRLVNTFSVLQLLDLIVISVDANDGTATTTCN